MARGPRRGQVKRRQLRGGKIVFDAVAYAGKDEQGKKVYRWSSGHRSPIEAERALAKLHKEIDQGAGTPRQNSKTTVREFVARWLPTMEPPTVRPSTYSSYKMNVETHIIPGLGGFELAKLGTEELTRFYGHLSRPKPRGKGLAVKTVKNIHVVVRRALADAVRWGYVATNVAASVHLPRAPKPETTAWSAEQLRTFLKHVRKDELYAMWLLFATTGLRRGEVAGLRWVDLDLDKGRLSVRAPLVVVDYKVVVSEPKTAQGRRTIALDPATVEALRELRRSGELVFTRKDGSPVHPQRISAGFLQHVKAAGLPRIRLHDVRHTYATAALTAGVPVKVLSERMGHSDVTTTLTLYAHVLEGQDEEAASSVASFILG